MAVQAQYPSNALSPNFKISNRDESDAFQEHEHPGDHNLMSNAYGSRKRDRDVDAAMIQQYQFPISSKIPKTLPMISSNREAPPHSQDRIMGSAGTSTSGRPSQLHNGGIDAFIGLHNAKLRSDLGRIQAKHYNQLLRIVENQASKRITEKDSQLAFLKKQQSELENRLNQIAMENRFWQAAAENSEAAVAALKASLDQALARCHTAGAHAADAESCCYGGDREEVRRRSTCKVCGEKDVSVLVLPCRHLCLCDRCDQGTDTCPICYGAKNVGMQVFLD